MVYKRKDAVSVTKHGVKMYIYNNKRDSPYAAVVYQETEKGHTQEFYNEKSTFLYYILEGSGIWIIEDECFEVEKNDVIIIPPGKRFYFKGNVKQICITAPAWEEEHERHVKFIDDL
jgi:mannose-6-phosphate isomerase-like protein (cupin superfamily)